MIGVRSTPRYGPASRATALELSEVHRRGKWPTITLDHCCIVYAYEESPSAAAHRRDVRQLLDLLDRGVIRISTTSAGIRDLDRDPDEERRRRLLDAIRQGPPLPVRGDPFRLGISRLGGPDMLGFEDQEERIERITRILFPTFSGSHPRAVSRKADIDHLVTHQLSGNDVFVTANTKDFTASKRRRLWREEGIAVMAPAEALMWVKQQRPHLFS